MKHWMWHFYSRNCEKMIYSKHKITAAGQFALLLFLRFGEEKRIWNKRCIFCNFNVVFCMEERG